jgi:hypothetical protein
MIAAPTIQHRLNWRVSEFCEAYHMGRTKFYSLVNQGKIRTVKCGRTTLITGTEAERFQSALEAGRF